MTVIDDYFCTLRLEPNGLIPLTPEEPDDFIHEISGKILCGRYDNTRDQIAGLFRVYYVNFELGQNHNMSAFDILDAYQHTFDYADAVLGSNGSLFSERLQNLLEDEIWNFNLLILDRIELLPKYRGRCLGLLVMRSLIERFGAGAGVVGIKPFPLQFELKELSSSRWRTRLGLENFPADSKKATRKLKDYYGRLGFVPMRSTPFMFLSTAWALPSEEQLCANVRE